MNQQKEKKKVELSLEDKLKLIKQVDNGTSRRKVAIDFNISKSTSSNIYKRKNEYIEQYEKSTKNDIYRKLRKTENEDINILTWDFFTKARACDLPISGPIIQEAAKKIAQKLGKVDFIASNGWLESFRQRNQLSFKVLSGEIKSSDHISAANYLQKIPTLIEGYKTKNIFNGDETCLFYQALPKKSLIGKYKSAQGKKYSKKKLSVLLIANALGERLKPIVVGKSKNPRCFSNIKVQDLPVIYKSSKNAWVTSQIFKDSLEQLNLAFKNQSPKILLFIDNCSAHIHLELSNIKLLFLPPNTTPIIQPLDQGIISAFKQYYLTSLIQKYLTQIENVETDQLNYNFKEIDVLDALFIIKQSWEKISVSCFKKSFQKAGFGIHLLERQQNQIEIEQNQEELIIDELRQNINQAKQLNILTDQIPINEYIEFDNQQKCTENDSTFDDIIQQILSEHNYMEEEEQDDSEDDENDCHNKQEQTQQQQQQQQQQLTYRQVYNQLEQIKLFIKSKEPSLINNIIDIQLKFQQMLSNQINSKSQSNLFSYFSKA